MVFRTLVDGRTEAEVVSKLTHVAWGIKEPDNSSGRRIWAHTVHRCKHFGE